MSPKDDELKQDSGKGLGWQRLKEGMGIFQEAWWPWWVKERVSGVM